MSTCVHKTPQGMGWIWGEKRGGPRAQELGVTFLYMNY